MKWGRTTDAKALEGWRGQHVLCRQTRGSLYGAGVMSELQLISPWHVSCYSSRQNCSTKQCERAGGSRWERQGLQGLVKGEIACINKSGHREVAS